MGVLAKIKRFPVQVLGIKQKHKQGGQIQIQGMPQVKAPEQRGDLFVEIEITLPVPLTDEERRRFIELRRLRQGPNDLFS